jgi:hypothetical protein
VRPRRGTYEKDIRTKAEMRQRAVEGDAFRPEWNYTVKQRNPAANVAVIVAIVLTGPVNPSTATGRQPEIASTGSRSPSA